MRIMAVFCYSTLGISTSSKNGTHPGILQGTWPTTSLPYTYSIRATGIIDSLEQSNSFPNGLIFVKATNAATIKKHVRHYKISDVSASL